MKAFFDIDTQLDFMFPGGALYGPGAERLISAITTLNQYAGNHKIPLISTTDAHPENAAEFRVWPPHCTSQAPSARKSRRQRCWSLMKPCRTIRPSLSQHWQARSS